MGLLVGKDRPVLSGESILCFAPDPWDDIWRNRHQIMSLFARQNKVLYVEPRHYLRPLLQRLGKGQLSWAEISAPRLERIAPGLHVYHQPLYAPISGRPPLSTFTQALRNASLRHCLRRLHMQRPILWLFRPDMVDVPGHLTERLVIYHIVDEYSGYADVDASRVEDIQRRERQLIARADLVLVTSEALWQTKRGLNPHTYWVPNAVDYERFAQATAEGPEPDAVSGSPRPRIGYVGAINDKIDTELLLRVAKAYPNASLVLVGPVRMVTPAGQSGIEALKSCANVRLVGQVPVEQVPAYMAHCDVGLLPYRDGPWTSHIHPLKLYEYLACGLPVVATDIPSVRQEREVVDIASTPEQFVAAVATALECDSEASRALRRERAAQNTWQQRVERISELISARLQDKGEL
jgi:glycosyltransferase involved in cell wall biosynthesis